MHYVAQNEGEEVKGAECEAECEVEDANEMDENEDEDEDEDEVTCGKVPTGGQCDVR